MGLQPICTLRSTEIVWTAGPLGLSTKYSELASAARIEGLTVGWRSSQRKRCPWAPSRRTHRDSDHLPRGWSFLFPLFTRVTRGLQRSRPCSPPPLALGTPGAALSQLAWTQEKEVAIRPRCLSPFRR